MMVKQSILLSLLLTGILINLNAQRQLSTFGVETDPFSTVFGARTISFVVEPPRVKNWSLFLNVSKADFSERMEDFLNPNNKGKGLETSIKWGSGFGIDYFKNENKEGLYCGVINLFFRNQVSKNNSAGLLTTHNIIPRVGYRWFPFKKVNLYVNPFMGMRYEYSMGKKLVVDETEFLPAGIQPFGTVHIGYHF